jgi:hypothetical protein
MLRTASLVAVAVVTAVGPCTVASAQPPTSTAVRRLDTASTLGARPTTNLVLTVRGCNGCVIGIQRAIAATSPARPKRPQYWDGPSGTVRKGRLVLRVPTRDTAGMSFTIRTPWEDDVTNAVTNIVLGYPTRSAGSRVSVRAARTAGRATACWAGTSHPRARFHVRVRKIHARTLEGKPGQAPLAWASPTKRVLAGTWATTWRGNIGNQDAYIC